MPNIDLKTLTPDTTLPSGAVIFGADSQAATSPSVYPVSNFARWSDSAGSALISPDGSAVTVSALAGGTGRTALSAISLAASRRIDLVMLGDSNQAQAGYGFNVGLEKALASRFAIYASPVFSKLATNNYHSAGGNPFAANDSSVPAELNIFRRAESNVTNGSLLIEEAYLASGTLTGSTNVGGFTLFETGPLLNGNELIRLWFAYGVRSSWADGTIQPGARETDTYSALVTGSSISTTGAPSGLRLGKVDIDAAVRTYNVEALFRLPGGNIVGPLVQYYARAEIPSRTAGISVSTLKQAGGQSMWHAAWDLQNTSDISLTTYFAEIRRLQLSAGQAPVVVIYLNFGFNDRNLAATTLPSLGPKRLAGAASGADEYVDNIRGVQDRIRSVWARNRWPLGELHWLIVPSHRIADPDNASLVAYRSEAASQLGSEPQTSVVDLGALMTYSAALSAGWYEGSGEAAVHLSSTGYDAVADLIVDLVPA